MVPKENHEWNYCSNCRVLSFFLPCSQLASFGISHRDDTCRKTEQIDRWRNSISKREVFVPQYVGWSRICVAWSLLFKVCQIPLLWSDQTRDLLPGITTHILEKHTDEVWHTNFSHNGNLLASASKDTTGVIWNIGESVLLIISCLKLSRKSSLWRFSVGTKVLFHTPHGVLTTQCFWHAVIKLWSYGMRRSVFPSCSNSCYRMAHASGRSQDIRIMWQRAHGLTTSTL